VAVSVVTRIDESMSASWRGDFEVRLTANFGRQLRLELQMTNRGNEKLRAEEALHAYFSVGDARQISISGLDGVSYLDKTDSNARKRQIGEIRLTAETDRIYLNTEAEVAITDPARRRRILIGKRNSHNTVIWNPWIEKAHALADFGDDAWTHMVCVEPSNVGEHSIELAAGQQHTMTATVEATSL